MLRPWNLQIALHFSKDKAIYIQIADAIIHAIKSGQLLGGQALPGSRQLAAQIKVNRNTVIEALDILLAEGWLVSRERKGTFVSDILPRNSQRKPEENKEITANRNQTKVPIIFDDGLPDSRLAPMVALARAYRQIFNRKARWQMMGYGNPLGDMAFRTAIVEMLHFNRGMNITTPQVCITRGSQMAMYLTSHCLLKKGDYVMIENPGYKPAWQAFEHAGAKLLPVPVDKDGLDIDTVKAYLKKYKNIKAIYTTPHHQFPTTVTMCMQKRVQLIELSNKYGFTIIEDDYDHEFHFGPRPILPLSSFDNVLHYVYIGTLSKIVAPALRIGFLVSSQDFIESVGQLRKIIDVQGDNIMEQAVLELIKDGEVKRHLKRTAVIYKQKRDYVEMLLQKHLQGKATFVKPDGGLAFWVVPDVETDIFGIAKKLLALGISIITPDHFSFSTPINCFRLGYASLSEQNLEKGIAALGKLL